LRILFSFVLLLCLPLLAWSQGRPPLPKPYLRAPVVMDGRALAEAWVFPRELAEDSAVEATVLLPIAKVYLKDELYARLEKSVSPEGVLTHRDLKAVGYSVIFDQQTLELRLNLPAKYRQPIDLDLNYVEFGSQKYQRPDAHNGYLNLRTLQSWQYGADVESERLPFTGTAEFLENIKGFVFESGADLHEGSENSWHRQDTRIRHDDEENMIRYTLGDLTFRSTGFQLSPSMAGFAATREFSIQPYKTLKPLSNTEIIIKRPSLVEIYVNGFLFSQLRLAPGVFNIRDFPLATGQSSVRIKVRDDLGQEETYDFSLLYENSLLAKDVQEFSYAAGLPWTASGGDRSYDDSAAFVSLFHRRGITDQFTIGLNLQSYYQKLLLGTELSGVSKLGYLSLQVANGSSDASTSGFAERLTYRSLDKILGTQVPFLLSLEAENQDRDFKPVTVVDFADPLRYLKRYDAQLNYRFESAWLMGVGTSLLEYQSQADQRIYRSNIMIPIGSQIRFEVAYQKILQQNDEDRVLVSFFWNEKQGYYSASSYYDSQNKTSNVAVTRNNRYMYDDYRWNASVQNSENGNVRSVTGEYLAQPMSVRFDHFNTEQNGLEANTTSLGVNTGFAWVGTHGAFTQPINDSFVLLHAENLPEGQVVVINPSGEKGLAQLGPRKSTVLREVASYYLNTVNVDSTSLPLGYLVDQEFYGTQLTYRSGLLIDLKIKKRVMIKGQFQDSKGQALDYAAGDIFDAKNQLIDNSFFTNKEGRFLIEGLEPGTYTIVTDKNVTPFTFEIPVDTEKVLNLGTVKLRDKGVQ
jgi:outer membrane usher protein